MTHRIGAMLLAVVQEASLSVEIRICPPLFPTSAASLPGRHHFVYLAGRSFQYPCIARSSSSHHRTLCRVCAGATGLYFAASEMSCIEISFEHCIFTPDPAVALSARLSRHR